MPHSLASIIDFCHIPPADISSIRSAQKVSVPAVNLFWLPKTLTSLNFFIVSSLKTYSSSRGSSVNQVVQCASTFPVLLRKNCVSSTNFAHGLPITLSVFAGGIPSTSYFLSIITFLVFENLICWTIRCKPLIFLLLL